MVRAPSVRYEVVRCDLRSCLTLGAASATLAEHGRFDATDLYLVRIAKQAISVSEWVFFIRRIRVSSFFACACPGNLLCKGTRQW
jgi:hypothetical protein